MVCGPLDTAHFLGKKWTIVLLEEIAAGNFSGFNDFLKKSGLTPKTLSGQLREMERLGLIDKPKTKKPVYLLTEKGSEFRNLVKEVKKFNIKWDNLKEDCLEKSCLDCGKLVKKENH